VKSSRLLPWVGWNASRISFLLQPLSDGPVAGQPQARPVARVLATDEPFIEASKHWWERYAAAGNWESAARIGKFCAQVKPSLAYGWENWAWALHKLGRTAEARKMLAPLLRGLELPGPPSGRAAYCLACFCGALERTREAARWLRLAHTLAEDRDALRLHALREPDLRSVWPGLAEFHADAVSILE